MHGTFERNGDNIKPVDLSRKGDIVVLAIPTLLALAMVALALMQPSAATWIAEAGQIESAASVYLSEPAPTQLALPAGAKRAVRTN